MNLPASASPAPPPPGFSQKAHRTHEQPISYLVAVAVGNPKLISFAAGLVDPLTLPTAEVHEIIQRLLAEPAAARKALQYGTTAGDAALRDLLLRHVCRLDGVSPESLSLTPAHVVLTTGSQQGLYLCAETLLDPGDIVIAANPSYFVYTGTLQSFGAQVRTVPMDDDGMDVEAVAKLLGAAEQAGELSKVKFVYCQTYFQNPTGLTLSAERRKRLVEIVRSFSRPGHRILILEDAAYRELAYDDDVPLTSLKRFDPENRYVVSSYTFSKPFAPGIKLGYGLFPADVVDAVLQQKGNHDFGSPNLAQAIALEALRSGIYQKHLVELRNGYRAKRDAMLSALEKHMPRVPGLSWTVPGGGLYVWMTLPEPIDTRREGGFFQACLAKDVLYVPGAYCHQPDAAGRVDSHHCRLSFGVVPIEMIETGIARMAEVVREQLAARRAVV